MVNNNQIDLSEVLQTLFRYKYFIIVSVIVGGIVGFYIASKSIDTSIRYGVKIYGFPDYKISKLINLVYQSKSLKYENLNETKHSKTESIRINLSDPMKNKYSFIESFLISENKNKVFLDMLLNKVFFTDLLNEIIENNNLNEGIDPANRINTNNLKKYIEFSNVGESSDSLRAQAIFYLTLGKENKNALKIINLILDKAIKETLLEFNEQFIFSLDETREEIEKNINKLSNENHYENLLKSYLEFLIISSKYAKENAIKNKKVIENSLSITDLNNEMINDIKIHDNINNFNYFLNGYESIDLEYNFIKNNFDNLKKILASKNIINLSKLDWFQDKLKYLDLINKNFNEYNLQNQKFNYDMSEPLIETSRDYSLVYILSTIVIFLIFSIFLSILLDSRK